MRDRDRRAVIVGGPIGGEGPLGRLHIAERRVPHLPRTGAQHRFLEPNRPAGLRACRYRDALLAFAAGCDLQPDDLCRDRVPAGLDSKQPSASGAVCGRLHRLRGVARDIGSAAGLFVQNHVVRDALQHRCLAALRHAAATGVAAKAEGWPGRRLPRSRRHYLVEGLLLGFLLGLLCYDKITFFLAGLVAAGVGLALSMLPRSLRLGVSALAGFAVVSILVELIFRLHITSYFHDLIEAAVAQAADRADRGNFDGHQVELA